MVILGLGSIHNLPYSAHFNLSRNKSAQLIHELSSFTLKELIFMKNIIIAVGLLLSTTLVYGQHSLIGIQNSNRKGMIHVAMNPAEINHLHRKVEVNLFSGGATVSNNALSFRDIIEEEGDLLDLAFDRINEPVNLSAEMQLLGPSFGFSTGEWSFGFISQAFAKADIIDLDPNLGEALTDNGFFNGFNEVLLGGTSNQKVYASGWTELGVTAGRELWADDSRKHVISAGATAKLLVPAAYINARVTRLRATLIQNGDEFSLTDAQGGLHFSYPKDLEDQNIEDYMLDRFSLGNISGVAFDLGLTHQWTPEYTTRLRSGISVRNIGGMSLGSVQSSSNYSINIPQGQAFRLDLLNGDLDEIEDQLLNSGYFTANSRTEEVRAALPTIISAYTDAFISENFQVSISGQFRIADKTGSEQLVTQNVFAVTPRLTLGIFEVYSPWAHYEVSGLTGGLGFRLGGFFLGSQSVLTGLLADTKQADVHLGFSMGFGHRTE